MQTTEESNLFDDLTIHQTRPKGFHMLRRKIIHLKHQIADFQEDLEHEAESRFYNRNHYFTIHVDAFKYLENGFQFSIELDSSYDRAKILIDCFQRHNIHIQQEFCTQYDSEDEEYEYPTKRFHSSFYSAEQFVELLNYLESKIGKKGFEEFYIYADKLTHVMSSIKDTIYCECRGC